MVYFVWVHVHGPFFAGPAKHLQKFLQGNCCFTCTVVALWAIFLCVNVLTCFLLFTSMHCLLFVHVHVPYFAASGTLKYFILNIHVFLFFFCLIDFCFTVLCDCNFVVCTLTFIWNIHFVWSHFAFNITYWFSKRTFIQVEHCLVQKDLDTFNHFSGTLRTISKIQWGFFIRNCAKWSYLSYIIYVNLVYNTILKFCVLSPVDVVSQISKIYFIIILS